MHGKPSVILALGDSKSAPDSQTWAFTLAGRLATATGNPWRAIEMGRGGYTVAKVLDNLTTNHDGAQFTAPIIDDVLTNCSTANATRLEQCQQALGTQQPTYILLDLGANDVGFGPPWVLPDQTTWQNNYIAIFDVLHAQWPGAQVYVSTAWKTQPGGDNTIWDTLATYTANAIAARSTFVHALDDERGWFQSCGATCSPDVPPSMIHFNTVTGSTLAAGVKLTALGF